MLGRHPEARHRLAEDPSLAQVLKTLRIPIEDGATPWPPDGKAPGDR